MASFESLFGTPQQAAQPAAPPAAPVPQAQSQAQPQAQAQPNPLTQPANPSMMDALADQIGQADASGERNPYFIPGVYPVCELLMLTMKQNGVDKHWKMIAEFMILNSKVPERPPGTTVGWVRDLQGKYPDSTAAECRRLIAAVMGVDWQQIDGKIIRMICDQTNQPAAGRLVAAEGWCKEGKKFTNVTFTPIAGTMEEHKAIGQKARAELGLTPF